MIGHTLSMLYSFLERLDEYLKELHEEKKSVTFLDNEKSNNSNKEDK